MKVFCITLGLLVVSFSAASGSEYPTWYLPDGAMIRLGKGHLGGGL